MLIGLSQRVGRITTRTEWPGAASTAPAVADTVEGADVAEDTRSGLPGRIAEKISPRDDGCWEWTGGRHEAGYGRVWDGEKVVPAHRLVYELLVGPIPDGLHIDHLCRFPPCVNPAHLEPVTVGDNVRRGLSATPRDECGNGHRYTDETLYVFPSGKRCCRICNAERKRAWRSRVRSTGRTPS